MLMSIGYDVLNMSIKSCLFGLPLNAMSGAVLIFTHIAHSQT